jgi:hypothetical protein
MSRIAYPFLRIPDEAIEFTGWHIGDVGLPLFPATEILEDWDYARDLTLSGSVTVDWEAASSALGFGDGDWLALAQLSIGTGQGHLPRLVRNVASHRLSKDSTSALFEVVVPGQSLSAQLIARLDIVLLKSSASASELSPVAKGSRLWREELDVIIEDGGNARFPVSSISFQAAFADKPHQFAPWYVDWRPEDLFGDFSSKVVLYVNSDEELFLERFMQGERLTVQAVLGGVAAQMCSTVLLHNTDELDFDVFEEGSVGGVLRHWLHQAFPDESGVASLVRLLHNDPGAFNAAMIAVADMGDRS